SLVAPLANAVAIPLVSLGVVPVALAGLVLPGDLLLGAAAQGLHWTLLLLQEMADKPFATFARHAPEPWALSAALAGVGWLLAPAGVPARWLGVPATLPLVLLPAVHPSHADAWLDVLD